LPSIGYHRQLSPEGLLSIQADALVGSDHMGPQLTLDVLSKAGVQVIQQATPQSIDTLISNIESLALHFKQQDQGANLIRTLQEKSTLLTRQVLKQKTAVFILNMGGHGGGTGSMAGKGTAGHTFLNILGLNNLADFSNYREASRESLLALDPDVIIVAGRSTDSIDHSGAVALTRAAQNKSVTYIDASALVAGLSLAALDEALRVKTRLTQVH